MSPRWKDFVEDHEQIQDHLTFSKSVGEQQIWNYFQFATAMLTESRIGSRADPDHFSFWKSVGKQQS